MVREPLLPPDSLARYADAIVRASLGIGKEDTLVVQGQPEHRELLIALAESAYRAGAQFVDIVTVDPLVLRTLLVPIADGLVRGSAVRSAAAKMEVKTSDAGDVMQTAGWLKLPFWPCVFYMAIGKFARYLTMTAGGLWLWPGQFTP